MNSIYFVDKTIKENFEVTFIAVIAKDSFNTFKNIDNFMKKNFGKIINDNIREIAKKHWKSQHVLMVTGNIKNTKN